MSEKIPFIDLQAQRELLGDDLELAIKAVLDHGMFIMGPEVAQCEVKLAERAQARFAITCSSGTDALVMALMALGIGPGDVVFVPAFTFVATAEAVSLVGARPFFVDVLPDTMVIDPASLDAAVSRCRREGMGCARAVIAVDMFGIPADYAAVAAVAESNGIEIIADAAQSFGASRDGRPVGSLARVTTTSFFPAKPLGCYGDGGAIFTDDEEIRERLVSVRSHGQGDHRYEHVRIGLNGRFDTIQAAVLLKKLTIYDREIVQRGIVATNYSNELADAVEIPVVPPGVVSTWAQYTIRHHARDVLAAQLNARGIPTAVHYPKPLNRQAPFADCPVAPGGVPISESLAQKVLSLPMHPYLTPAHQQRIVAAVLESVSAHR